MYALPSRLRGYRITDVCASKAVYALISPPLRHRRNMEVQDYDAYNTARRLFAKISRTPDDSDAFVENCGAAICAWARAYCPPDAEVADATQHLFLRLLENQVWDDPERAFKLTLWTALHNEFFNYCRGLTRRADRSRPVPLPEEPVLTVDQIMEANRAVQRLNGRLGGVLRRLDAGDRLEVALGTVPERAVTQRSGTCIAHILVDHYF
jgi:DNA-directed RNA polymerase specialized sigma24 family protein